MLLKKNVYAAGIKAAHGDFGAMDAVIIVSDGVEIARGLINYSAKVCALSSHRLVIRKLS